ncbi:MAG: hypothetical protein ACRDJC_21710, partial [Thermomicrobiales bacterium]
MPTGATARPDDDHGPRRTTSLAQAIAPDRPAPFAWQDGRRLWILDGGLDDWVLAELIFEPRTCSYLEVRRSSYQWPREAVGAFLSRALVGGQRRAEDAARGLCD